MDADLQAFRRRPRLTLDLAPGASETREEGGTLLAISSTARLSTVRRFLATLSSSTRPACRVGFDFTLRLCLNRHESDWRDIYRRPQETRRQGTTSDNVEPHPQVPGCKEREEESDMHDRSHYSALLDS
jgi:hypothetical protein